MHMYCKAYLLKDLRQFEGWSEKYQEGEEQLPDDHLGFVWDDFTVTKAALSGDQHGYIYDNVTPEWKAFCKDVLNFEIPEDLRELYQEAGAVAE
jgi:hypothetical protein